MKELTQYYKSIQRLLPCTGVQKKRFMHDMIHSVNAYLLENPNVSFDAVASHFGTPQEIADTYIEEIPPLELRQKLKRKKQIVNIIAAVAASIVLLWGAVVTIALINELNDADGSVIAEAPLIED